MPCDLVAVSRAAIVLDMKLVIASDEALNGILNALKAKYGSEVTLRKSGQSAVIQVGYDTTVTINASGISVTHRGNRYGGDNTADEVKATIEPLAKALATELGIQNTISVIRNQFTNTSLTALPAGVRKLTIRI